MKKLLFFILFSSLLFVTSCNENFEDIKSTINNKTSASKTEELIGQWKLSSAVLANGTDVTNSCFQEEVIEFNIDGTYFDRRNQLNSETNLCESVGEFLRAYDIEGRIFETTKKELVIGTYKILDKDTLVLNFTIPFEASVTYSKINYMIN